MKKWMTLSLALALVLTLWGGAEIRAQDTTDDADAPAFVDEDGDGIDDNAARKHRFGRRHRRGARFSLQLTDEQKTALKAKIDELKEAGATHAEIREAIGAELEALGVELPERGLGRLGSLLTEEQQTALKAKIDALKEAGASREDIRAAVDAELEALGIERPERRGRFGSLLTEEQQAALKAKIDALKAEGATREDVHAAIHAEFEALGIELPERGGKGAHGMRGRRGFRGRGGRR